MAHLTALEAWHDAPRRERGQTLFTAAIVLALALLVAASYLL